MTFSIVAAQGDAYGVAVASKFLAVGSVVPEVRAGTGAVATQAMARVAYRTEVLSLLAAGLSSQAAVDALTARDEGAAHRQLGVVGVDSQATYTGAECMSWAGGVAGSDDGSRYAIQGNILVGPQVVEAMEQAWLAGADLEFDDRLLAALTAGDEAGGDSRGRQSAAVYAAQPGTGYDSSGVLLDLRVDDHAAPVGELVRLAGLHRMTFRGPEEVLPLTGELADEVGARLARLGHEKPEVADALAAWAGVENFEMRLTDEGIDSRLLEALRSAT